MSTREKALSIFNRLNERQLEGFIALFSEILPKQSNVAQISENVTANDEFDGLERFCKYIPNFDEKAELAAYREERIGK